MTERDLLQATRAHLTPADKHVLSFEKYDMVQPPSDQQPAEQKPVGLVEGMARAFRESPADLDRQKEQTELSRITSKNPRAEGPVAAYARSAVTTGANALIAPVRLAGEALEYAGVPNAAAHLDANEAYADAESLIRDETSSESRERALLSRAANPRATLAGEGAGDLLAGAVTAGAEKALPAMKSGAKAIGMAAAERALNSPMLEAGRSRVMQLGYGEKPFQVSGASREIFGRDVVSDDGTRALLGDLEKHAKEIGVQGERPVVHEVRGGKQGGAPYLRVSAHLKDADGWDMGTVTRYYRKDPKTGKVTVDHALFSLSDRAKGRGLGKKVIRNQVSEYDRLGVDEIVLSAEDDGKYVWPAMGFEHADPAQLPRAVQGFRQYLRDHGASTEELQAAQSIRSLQDIAKYQTKIPTTRTTFDKGTDRRLTVSGEDYLRNFTSPGATEFRADLNGSSGEALRSYLGLPPRSRSSTSQALTSSKRSSDRFDLVDSGWE